MKIITSIKHMEKNNNNVYFIYIFIIQKIITNIIMKKKSFIIKLIYIQTSMADNLWKALLAEFLGTFTLVFVGASAVALTLTQGGSVLTSAFAFGLALMSIIYIWGPYSGAHVNPAVSFGFAVAGQMNWGLMLGYWIAQLLGGIAAAALVAYFFGTATGSGASVGTATNTDAWKAVLMEAFITFFLVLAYLFIYRNPMLAIVSGVIIGLVLTFCVISGGFISGGSTNPARSLGPAIFSNNLGTYWIYIVGPLLGALVAALIYKLFTVDYSCCYKVDECGNRLKDECGNCLKVCKRPVVDNCGRPVMDCGKQVYEEYAKVDRKYSFTQETPMRAIGEWMSEHGFDPRYIKQELDHHKKFEHMRHPKEIIETVIETVTIEPTQVVEPVIEVAPTVPVLPVTETQMIIPSTTAATTAVEVPQGLMVNAEPLPTQGLMGTGALSSQRLMSSPRMSPQGFSSRPSPGFASNQGLVSNQGLGSTTQAAVTDALSTSPFSIPRY